MNINWSLHGVKEMPKVKVRVTKIVDMSFPIFVECELEDYKGVIHYFIDKAPVLIGEYDFFFAL